MLKKVRKNSQMYPFIRDQSYLQVFSWKSIQYFSCYPLLTNEPNKQHVSSLAETTR